MRITDSYSTNIEAAERLAREDDIGYDDDRPSLDDVDYGVNRHRADVPVTLADFAPAARPTDPEPF